MIRGLHILDFRKGGYTAAEMKEIGMDARDLRLGAYTVRELRRAKYGVAAVQAAGYTAPQLREGGFDALEMRICGLTMSYILSAGYTTVEIANAGLSVEQMLQHFTVGQLLADGWTADGLRQAGVSWNEIMRVNDKYDSDGMVLKRMNVIEGYEETVE